MSKIKNAFKNGKAFIGYLTCGDPNIEKCEEFVLEMVKAGADLVEIGIPFSDPVAEGPINQNSNIRALSAGTTTDRVFEMIGSIREKTNVPLVLLTYLNPVFVYGYDKFFSRCQELGIDGIIVPDLPFEEKGEMAQVAKNFDVDVISLITPTSNERIRMIAEDAQGFVYIVSSMGVTGIRDKINTDIKSIVEIIRQTTDIPCAVGFGINTPEQAKELSEIADGVIVGSAIVKIIEEYGENAAEHIFEYVSGMKKAIQNS